MSCETRREVPTTYLGAFQDHRMTFACTVCTVEVDEKAASSREACMQHDIVLLDVAVKNAVFRI